MAEGGGQERTEAATPKRRSDARKRGQVTRSADLPGAVALLGLVVALHLLGPAAWERLATLLSSDLQQITRPDISSHDALSLLMQSVLAGVIAVLPIMLVLMITGVVAGFAQTGMAFSGKALMPQFSRVNPMAGAKRLFSMRSGFELLKMIIRLGVLAYIAISVVNEVAMRVLSLGRGGLQQAPPLLGDIAYTLILRVAITGGVLAAIDYMYQRWRLTRELRMTKQEVKDELRQSEGDPQIKARVRRLQRELARRRMMQEVPKATAVVVNPTHYAVALRYVSGKTRAPIVVAKGQDLIAQQIKEIAQRHNVPVLENPPLARGLFAGVALNKEIPAQFYRAVAEVLAFVYRLKRRW